MKKSTLSILMGLALIAVPAANAEGLSYTHIEANYLTTDLEVIDGVKITGNGFGLGGNFAFGDTGLYGLGSYESIGEKIGGVDFDVDRLTLGLGYVLKLTDRAHFLAEAAYLDYDFGADDGFDSASDSADGYRASIGFRGLLADNIEGIAKAGYQKVEVDGLELYDGAVGEVGIRWLIDRAWSVGVTSEVTKDETTFKAGLRASF